ncbi:MAG: transcription-repair coupling factor [Elusimicrobiota bacterium]
MKIWKKNNQYKDIIKGLKSKDKVTVSGLTDSALSSLTAEIFDQIKSNILIVVEKEKDISIWTERINSFSKASAMPFPSDYPSKQIQTIKELLEPEPGIVICCQDSVKESVYSPSIYRAKTIGMKTGEKRYTEIVNKLAQGNYIRCDVVGEQGEFARRGKVIDFWPPGSQEPIRILFEKNTIKQIKTFNPLDQRSKKEIEKAEIIPAEFPDKAEADIKEYLGDDYILVLPEEEYREGLVDNKETGTLQRVYLKKAHHEFSTRSVSYAQSFSEVIKELESIKESGYKSVFTAPGEHELDKLLQTVEQEAGIKGDGFVSNLDQGFICDDIKTAVLTVGDILPYKKVISPQPPPPPHPMEEFSDLEPGDFVVHRRFGIGEFQGMEKVKHNSSISDFLKIKYAKEAALYVAVENADIIQKYIGSKWKTKLDSLSGKSWQRTIKTVRKSVEAVSKKLLHMYKQREKKGRSFEPHPEVEKEFAEYFPYKLTRHQKEAIQEVLEDMESDRAMDRLVCGDVGFGKTEVSMRASFRAVLNGSQVIVLAPTTVLARQHFHTFRKRFANFPVIIEMLSRLVSSSDQKRIIQKINDGRVDIVIGTHKLLSQKINFPNTGLLIIDEEQRFGVEQKEKLRFRFKNVDLLTTTATPIPRTLAMAMGKVKGFSLINTPPPGRQGIKTQVLGYNMDTIKKALKHEVHRGGQCYFVHSRVKTIKKVTENLKDKIPELKFKYIHGRMKSNKINSIMDEFITGDFDCLVTTTIIENGLDIPNVNTMIIDSAHRLGLADIYQLRGRIGRSSIKAYCFLMYPPHLELTPRVKERMSALKSFSALGSGFQLALRDLQIRGAGELLGPRQHGNIMKVGFEYYSTILKQEIAKLRGEEYIEPIEVEISLPVSAYIPEDYVQSSGLRLAFYRKLSSVTEKEKLKKIKDEIKDRFGEIPKQTENLIKIINIKIQASKAKIKEISIIDSEVVLKLISNEKIKKKLDKKNIFSNIKNHINSIQKITSK